MYFMEIFLSHRWNTDEMRKRKPIEKQYYSRSIRVSSVAQTLHRPAEFVEQRPSHAADDWADDWNPRIAPIGIRLAWNRQHCVRKTRTEIARGIDRIAS